MVGIGDTTVINDGLIAGGMSAGGAQANAVEFTGGGNKLELWSNYDFEGDSIAFGASDDTFALGGVADGSFDVSRFGSDFQGFDLFVKEDSSEWDIRGNTTPLVTPWDINGGVLIVSAEGNLGSTLGDLSFDGGTLRVTGNSYSSTPRGITINSMGGGFDIDSGSNVFRLNQALQAGTPGGGLWKDGAGTLILNGANQFTGQTDVNEGTLVIGEGPGNSGARVLGDVYVDGGATLAGNGYIGDGNEVLYNSGTVSPGYNNTHGTLTVNGDYRAGAGYGSPGGVLSIDLDGLEGHGVITDTLAVTGTAFLTDTTLRLDKEFYELACGDQALVIDAGAYDGQVDLFDISDFDDLMLFDNGTGIVYGVGVAQGEDLGDLPGLTPNQSVIASALSDEVLNPDNFIDETLPYDELFLALIEDCKRTGAGLDSLSPEGYAGFTDYGMRVTRNYTRTAMGVAGPRPYTAPAPAPIEEKGAKGGMVSAKGGMEPAPAPIFDAKNTTAFAAFSHYDGGSDSSLGGQDYDINSNGGLVGLRHTMNSFTFGGFLGYDTGEVENTFLNADVDGWVAGLFGSYLANAEHNILISGGLTYGSYEFDGTRATIGGINTFGGVDSDVFDLWAGVRGDVYSNDKLRLTPSLELHYISSETDAINEIGGASALTVPGFDEDALILEIDFTAEYEVVENVLLLGSVGYAHNFMDAERRIAAAFGGVGTPFSVVAPGMGEDVFSVGVGAVWHATDAWTFSTGYRAEFGSDQDTSNSFGLGASYSF